MSSQRSVGVCMDVVPLITSTEQSFSLEFCILQSFWSPYSVTKQFYCVMWYLDCFFYFVFFLLIIIFDICQFPAALYRGSASYCGDLCKEVRWIMCWKYFLYNFFGYKYNVSLNKVAVIIRIVI